MEITREAVLQTFLGEAEEHLSRMEEALVTLETRPEDAELVKEVFRGAHTLKGDAASLELGDLAGFAHTVEDVLDRLRERTLPVTGRLVSLLLEAVDVMRRMAAAAPAGGPSPAPAELGARLAAAACAPEGRPAAPAAESSGRASRAAERPRTLRVGIDKLDRLLDLTGEIGIARGKLADLLAHAGGAAREELIEAHRAADRLHAELQEQVMAIRLVPLGPLFRQYGRAVRDTAAACGKLAGLRVEGEDVEVDTAIVHHLREPLLHMVRNAVDHGIERPEVRRARGKEGWGAVTLRAGHDAGGIVIEVADDGDGIDRAKLVARAAERGLPVADAADDDDVLGLVFEAGLSTADAVTGVSGRGVGMDVVRQAIEALRGAVTIASRPGEGTRFTIRLPLTLAIIDGLSVGVAGETYVVPLDAVTECLDLPEASRRSRDARGIMDLRGRPLPYVRLRELFGLAGPPPVRESVVVVQHGGGRIGIAVDALYGDSQTVIKPLGALLKDLPGVRGSAILGNGRVALILDVPRLMRDATGGLSS